VSRSWTICESQYNFYSSIEIKNILILYSSHTLSSGDDNSDNYDDDDIRIPNDIRVPDDKKKEKFSDDGGGSGE